MMAHDNRRVGSIRRSGANSDLRQFAVSDRTLWRLEESLLGLSVYASKHWNECGP